MLEMEINAKDGDQCLRWRSMLEMEINARDGD